METSDLISLLHPAIAVAFVFPIIGIVTNFAWQTRQRRIQSSGGGKSKIPPVVGREHVQLGRWLSGSVVGISLLALVYSVVYGTGGFIDQQKDGNLNLFQVFFILLMFAATISSFVFLFHSSRPAALRRG